MAIICACFPTTKPLLVRVFPHVLGSTGRETGPSAGASRQTVGSRDANGSALANGDGAGVGIRCLPRVLRDGCKSGSESLEDSGYGFEDINASSGSRAVKNMDRIGTTVRDKSLICGMGTPSDIGSVMDGQIRVVTQIAQDDGIRRLTSEEDVKSANSDCASQKSETSNERRLWKSSGLRDEAHAL